MPDRAFALSTTIRPSRVLIRPCNQIIFPEMVSSPTMVIVLTRFDSKLDKPEMNVIPPIMMIAYSRTAGESRSIRISEGSSFLLITREIPLALAIRITDAVKYMTMVVR